MEKCKNKKFILNKLCTKKTIYEIIKAKFIGIIYSQIHSSCLNLLNGHIITQIIKSAIQQEFDITCASKIGNIITKVINKSFIEFAII